MSESTPLLPQSSRSPRDYSIFYRVCHSPWPFVPPKALLGARIALALFLLGTLILDLVYDIAFAHTGRQYVFHFSHVSLVLQLIYLSCTAWWTYSYIGDSSTGGSLGASYDSARRRSSLWDAGQQVLAVRQTTKSLNGILFSFFYTAATTFPLVVTMFAWLVLYPSDTSSRPRTGAPISLAQIQYPFGEGASIATVASPQDNAALRIICQVTTHALNSIIALAEIMLLSSVKRQKPVSAYIVALLLMCAIYTIWVFLGRLITGEYVYKQLDPSYAGGLSVATSVINMLSLTISMFIVQYGLHNLRQTLVKRMEARREQDGN